VDTGRSASYSIRRFGSLGPNGTAVRLSMEEVQVENRRITRRNTVSGHRAGRGACDLMW